MGCIGEFSVPSLSLILCLSVRLETVRKVRVFLRRPFGYIWCTGREVNSEYFNCHRQYLDTEVVHTSIVLNSKVRLNH